MSSCIIGHVFNVVHKEKMEKVYWKVGEDLLVRSNVVSLDKGPPSSAKILV